MCILKKNKKTEVVRHNVRLVAKDLNQIKWENYKKVFFFFVIFKTIGLLFVTCFCLLKWYKTQVDINNAYLYADLDETVYMHQSEDYVNEKDCAEDGHLWVTPDTRVTVSGTL